MPVTSQQSSWNSAQVRGKVLVMNIRTTAYTLLICAFVLSTAAAQNATPQPSTEAKPVASDIAGTWMGTLDVGAIKLRVAFHITDTANGLTATMDSLDQGAKGLSVTSAMRQKSNLTLEMKQIGGAYNGEIAADGQSIKGTWTQMGNTMPLMLNRVKVADLEVRRPQVPAKPYPYREEEVTYDNKTQNVTLAATLTIPQGKGPFPAVLLITGSGPQDRDESLMGHKPFLVLADYLTRKGIAVLRADDRGVGKSTGKFSAATTADFATDAEAGAAYLMSRPEVDKRRIGLVGHSEGGVIAPMVAARNKDVAFIVMMAGTGVPGSEVILEQMQAIAKAGGVSGEKLAAATEDERAVLALFKTEKDDAVLAQKIRERMTGKMPEGVLNMQLQALQGPWIRYFVEYDPATALRKVTCPVLALNGEKDTQVLPKQNLPVIRQALTAAGNQHFEIVELPGLNHLFQTAKTGSPVEYGQIEETMAPLALDKMATWILAQQPITATKAAGK